MSKVLKRSTITCNIVPTTDEYYGPYSSTIKPKGVNRPYNKFGVTSTPYKNVLDNIFSDLGYIRGNCNFKAFGTPTNFNVLVSFYSMSLKQYFLSTKELKEHSYRLGNIPNYVKKVLDRIVEKYMSMTESQFLEFRNATDTQEVLFFNEPRVLYCPKHRKDVIINKCRSCKYMHDILPDRVICRIPEYAIIIKHKPKSKIKHLNK